MMPEAADTDTAQNILFLIATLLYYTRLMSEKQFLTELFSFYLKNE